MRDKSSIPYKPEELFAVGKQQTFSGKSLTEVAFPLGGIGTGTISLGGRGNLRDFEIFNKPAKGNIIPFMKNGIWQGSITAPSSVGSYFLSIKASDTSGNTAETSVPYRVVQLSGGPNIAVSPRTSSIVAGNTIPLSIKVKNNQNIDDTFKVRISVSELPASYQANLAWFDWTEKVVTLRSGQEVQIPIKVNPPAGTAKGSKLFRANVNSQTTSLKGFDTGYLTVK
jgi:hypothetical protein